MDQATGGSNTGTMASATPREPRFSSSGDHYAHFPLSLAHPQQCLCGSSSGIRHRRHSSPSQAVTCMTEAAWTAKTVSSSKLMTIPSQSDCRDLNASSARTRSDYVKGWYKSGSTWRGGTKGYVYVPKTENGWKVLLTDVANGAYVKGTALNLAQQVQYIY